MWWTACRRSRLPSGVATPSSGSVACEDRAVAAAGSSTDGQAHPPVAAAVGGTGGRAHCALVCGAAEGRRGPSGKIQVLSLVCAASVSRPAFSGGPVRVQYGSPTVQGGLVVRRARLRLTTGVDHVTLLFIMNSAPQTQETRSLRR